MQSLVTLPERRHLLAIAVAFIPRVVARLSSSGR